MHFFITEKYFNADGEYVRLIHNTFTGSKQIFVAGILACETGPRFFERRIEHVFLVKDTLFSLIVTPTWMCGFDYIVLPQTGVESHGESHGESCGRSHECSGGLLDTVLLEEALL